MQDAESQNELLEMMLVSCENSLFTNPHEMLYSSDPKDRRGTFTHLGVKFEGLESSRHLNWKVMEKDNEEFFYRDDEVVNNVEIRMGSSDIINKTLIKRLEFDTSFFTRNQVEEVIEVKFIDESVKPRAEVVVLQNVRLDGDSKKVIDITPTMATRIQLKLSEGGLSRFKAYGEVQEDPVVFSENLLSSASIFKSSDNSFGNASLVLRKHREGNVMAGWETCRHSYCQLLGISLNTTCTIDRIEIDTYLHRLNSLKMVSIFGCNSDTDDPTKLLQDLPQWEVIVPGGEKQIVTSDKLNDFIEDIRKTSGKRCPYRLVGGSKTWKQLLKFQSLRPDSLHEYDEKDIIKDTVTHLLVLGVPDGGLHRIGVFGSNME